MHFFHFLQNKLILFALPLCVAGLFVPIRRSETARETDPIDIDLALRRTADGLLRAVGDTSHRVPPVAQLDNGVWQVRIDTLFEYDALPSLLQTALEQYQITQPYTVAVRSCNDSVIVLGYHHLDLLNLNPVPPDVVNDVNIPCKGRVLPEGCYVVEVRFLEKKGNWPALAIKNSILLLVLGLLGGYWLAQWRKQVLAKKALAKQATSSATAASTTENTSTNWVSFGQCRLDPVAQVLECVGIQHTLTYREAKLLRLLASHPGELLERDAIIQQVWADEGILVGRSVDVFISRLRKKLVADTSVSIVAVHGIGYRLVIER